MRNWKRSVQNKHVKLTVVRALFGGALKKETADESNTQAFGYSARVLRQLGIEALGRLAGWLCL